MAVQCSALDALWTVRGRQPSNALLAECINRRMLLRPAWEIMNAVEG